jgi:NIMA-interacting peptidyl-prolyl cis-trans isomerase 1
MRAPMRPLAPPVRSFFCALLALAPLGLAGCATLATSPDWVGGELAVSAPARMAQEEARVEAERKAEEAQPKQIRARHVLVMHKASQRAPEGITRSRAEARERAAECLAKIRAGAAFEAMVTEYSDEPGAGARAGDLGPFNKNAMVKPFADAAFRLRVGEISELVETPYGFHVIQRTE